MEFEIIVIVAFFLQLIVAAMWIRSGFYLWRVRKKLNRTLFITLAFPVILGAILSTYNLSDENYLLMRFPIRAFVNITCAWAIYVISREYKEKLFKCPK